MNNETITVRVTETGQTLDVVVLHKHAEHIEVVVGEGIHSVKCTLHPTQTGMAYMGNVMGREIVYEHSHDDVESDIDHSRPSTRRR